MPTRRSLVALAFAGAGGWSLSRLMSNAQAANSRQRFPFELGDAEWRRRLTPAQFRVLRDHGTERPFSSPLDQEKRRGVFACAGCGHQLFRSETKYDSGTGWPSFHSPIPSAVGYRDDFSLFLRRTEVHCANCGGHIGHVFDDGPRPTGKRYCMNGVAMTFTPDAEQPGARS